MSEEKLRVTIEFIAWATVFIGGDGSDRKIIHEEADPGDTVRLVLKRLSSRHRELDQALWDRGSDELSEHLEIAVNDAILGVHHTLDSEVKDGDNILLMGQYMGG